MGKKKRLDNKEEKKLVTLQAKHLSAILADENTLAFSQSDSGYPVGFLNFYKKDIFIRYVQFHVDNDGSFANYVGLVEFKIYVGTTVVATFAPEYSEWTTYTPVGSEIQTMRYIQYPKQKIRVTKDAMIQITFGYGTATGPTGGNEISAYIGVEV